MYDQTTLQQDVKLSDITLSGMVRRRANTVSAHWESKYNLKKVREQNKKLYDTSYVKDLVLDDRYEDIFADNRMFVAVRTILPFITGRITMPDTIPGNGDDLSLQFADDFKRILVEQAEEVYGKEKIKLAVQDLLAGQRVGVLKWCYDAERGCLALEHLDPGTVLISHTTKLYEEPDFVQQTEERSIGDIVRQFPNAKDDVFIKFQIQKGVPSQLEKRVSITETWMKYDDGVKPKIIVVFMLDDLVLGKMTDPNWVNAKGKQNLIDYPMMPFVFINFLNDGSSYIDHTSFIEQAQYNQKNYDKIGQRITEDAQFGGIGVPVFGKGAIKQGEAAKIRFSPIQRVLLDVPDVNKSFTTWQSAPMPTFIPDFGYDSRSNVDNIFGINNLMRGESSDDKTLGQDVLLRDQSQGRQQEQVDCILSAMRRFYMLEGQLIYRFFDEDHFFKFLGDDGQFEELVISQKKIADNIGLRIKVMPNSNLPEDRAQLRATVLELAKINKIGTLRLYKALGIEDPDQAFKEFLLEQIDPGSLIGEVDKRIFDREAEEDLQLVIGGKIPKERDDTSEAYLNYLNEYLLTHKYEQLKPDEQQRVSFFVQATVLMAQQKLAKLQAQEPAPQPPLPPGNLPPGAVPPSPQGTPPSQPVNQPVNPAMATGAM